MWLFFNFFSDGLDKWCRFGCSETCYHPHLHQKYDAWVGLTCLANTTKRSWITVNMHLEILPLGVGIPPALGTGVRQSTLGVFVLLASSRYHTESLFRGETSRYAALSQKRPEFLVDCSDFYLCVSHLHPLPGVLSQTREEITFSNV